MGWKGGPVSSGAAIDSVLVYLSTDVLSLSDKKRQFFATKNRSPDLTCGLCADAEVWWGFETTIHVVAQGNP